MTRKNRFNFVWWIIISLKWIIWTLILRLKPAISSLKLRFWALKCIETISSSQFKSQNHELYIRIPALGSGILNSNHDLEAQNSCFKPFPAQYCKYFTILQLQIQFQKLNLGITIFLSLLDFFISLTCPYVRVLFKKMKWFSIKSSKTSFALNFFKMLKENSGISWFVSFMNFFEKFIKVMRSLKSHNI